MSGSGGGRLGARCCCKRCKGKNNRLEAQPTLTHSSRAVREDQREDAAQPLPSPCPWELPEAMYIYCATTPPIAVALSSAIVNIRPLLIFS
jgi:hypothetical protein